MPGGKRGREPASYGLSAEVLERSSDGDDNRRASSILPGVWGAGRTCSCTREGKKSRQSAGSLRTGQEDMQCKRWRDGKRDGERQKNGGKGGWRGRGMDASPVSCTKLILGHHVFC